MSYDITLNDPVTKESIELENNHNITGGTYAIGGTQVCTTTNGSSTANIAMSLQRQMVFINSVASQRIFSTTTVAGSQYNVSSAAFTNTTIDFNNSTLYFVVACTLANSADNITIFNVQSKISR